MDENLGWGKAFSIHPLEEIAQAPLHLNESNLVKGNCFKFYPWLIYQQLLKIQNNPQVLQGTFSNSFYESTS